MSAPYVCPSCRRNVLRHAASLRALPRTRKATFISFTSKTRRQTSEQDKTDPPRTSDVTDGNTLAGQARPEKNPLESGPSSSHLPSFHARSSNSSRSDHLASLFKVLGRSNKYSGSPLAESNDDWAPPAPQARRARASRSQPPQQKPAAKELDDILSSQQKTSKEAWDYFQSHYTDPQCPALKSPSYIDIHKLATGNIFRKLLGSIIHDWCAGKLESALPDPIVIAERYVYLGIMRPEFWQDLLWLLSVEAFKKSNSAAAEEPEKSPAEVTNQLVKLWDYLFKQSARPSDALCEGSQPLMESETPPAMWSALPASKPLTYAQSRNLRRFSARLGSFLPDVPHNRISYSALVTYDLLTREGVESRLDGDLLAQCKPFILFIAQLIPGSNLFNYSQEHSTADEMHSYLEASGVSTEDIAALFKRLKQSQEKSMNIIGASGGHKKIDGGVESSEESLAQFYWGRIERAYAQKKTPMVYELWELACQAMPRQRENPQAPEMPEELYNSTLKALMGLKQPDQAIHVWNTMIQNGTRPTIKTWTAMLDGCGKARDIHGLEQIWVRMLNSGVEPDAHAWSARISGILSAGKTEHGLRVLEEMGKIWVEAYNRAQVAAKGKDRPVNETELPAKPSTVVLNGAVTALSQTMTRTGRSRYLARVLAWGRSFGIMPDVITFNALISLSLRTGNAAEAMKLIQQMGEADVQPDVATFSIILSSIFRSASAAAMSQEEQNQKVMAVLKDLEDRGIKANAHVYSTLIDGLLRRHKNAQAAKAVMNYMTSKKIEISPHIFTILMTHYFEHEDFEAIEALWTQIQESETVVDIVFYDRMIERYAALGDTNKMMTFLTRMSREGLTPGYPALQAVVVKLAEMGDWGRFDEVVNDVKDGVGIAKRGLSKPNENVINQFWHAVERKQMQRPRPEDQLDLTQAR